MKKPLSIAAIAALPALSACAQDETLSGYVTPGSVYQLVEQNGAPYPHRANISFPEPGKVAGQAPCNRYFATLQAPYPWFGVSAIGATRMACPDLEAEAQFFAALEEMTLAETQGDTLILSDENGQSLVFRASQN